MFSSMDESSQLKSVSSSKHDITNICISGLSKMYILGNHCLNQVSRYTAYQECCFISELIILYMVYKQHTRQGYQVYQ